MELFTATRFGYAYIVAVKFFQCKNMARYVSTLLTQNLLEKLDPKKEYVLMLVDEPYALVKKDWLERRVGCCKILYDEQLLIQYKHEQKQSKK